MLEEDKEGEVLNEQGKTQDPVQYFIANISGHLSLLRCSNIYNINASLWQKKAQLILLMALAMRIWASSLSCSDMNK